MIKSAEVTEPTGWKRNKRTRKQPTFEDKISPQGTNKGSKFITLTELVNEFAKYFPAMTSVQQTTDPPSSDQH